MKNTILHGDCLELMKDIPTGSVDMILCDLPYGTTACKWDTIIPFEPLWEQYERIIKDNGAIVLFGSQPFTSLLISSNTKLFKYEWIWDKVSTGHPLNAKKMPLRKHENICVFYKKSGSYNPQYEKRTEKEKKRRNTRNAKKSYDSKEITGKYKTLNRDDYTEGNLENKYPNDILIYNSKSNDCSIANRVHPTQKPVALFEYLIKTYTNEGETVLDNCIGSGTTAIACINTKRNFIGIEKETKYIEIANERVEKILCKRFFE